MASVIVTLKVDFTPRKGTSHPVNWQWDRVFRTNLPDEEITLLNVGAIQFEPGEEELMNPHFMKNFQNWQQERIEDG